MKYSKEALVIVAELIERGFTLKRGGHLTKDRLIVWIGLFNVSISSYNRQYFIRYKNHQSINTVLKLVDGYFAWNK